MLTCKRIHQKCLQFIYFKNICVPFLVLNFSISTSNARQNGLLLVNIALWWTAAVLYLLIIVLQIRIFCNYLSLFTLITI